MESMSQLQVYSGWKEECKSWKQTNLCCLDQIQNLTPLRTDTLSIEMTYRSFESSNVTIIYGVYACLTIGLLVFLNYSSFFFFLSSCCHIVVVHISPLDKKIFISLVNMHIVCTIYIIHLSVLFLFYKWQFKLIFH